MRSNIVKVAEPTYSSPIFDVRNQRSQPLYEPRLPKAKRPQSTAKKSRLVLTPKEGWLAMLLLAVAVYCVVYSISSVGWVRSVAALSCSPALARGSCLLLYITDQSELCKTRPVVYCGHFTGCAYPPYRAYATDNKVGLLERPGVIY